MHPDWILESYQTLESYQFLSYQYLSFIWNLQIASMDQFDLDFLKTSLKANLVDLSDLVSDRHISKNLDLDIFHFELGFGLGLVDEGLDTQRMS